MKDIQISVTHRSTCATRKGLGRTTWLSVLVLAITTLVVSCGGGGGTSAFTTPLAASIDGGLQSAPENIINAATASMVNVTVELDDRATGDETVTVILTDGVNEVSASTSGVAGGGPVIVGPIDATGLADGPIEVIVQISAGGDVQSTSFGQVITKDTIAPAAPLALSIPATATNPLDVVNGNNAAALAVQVDMDGSADPSDLVSVQLSDGTAMAISPAQNAVAGGSLSFTGVDASGLADGSLTMTAQVVDAAGNPSSIQSTVSKDTVLPSVLLARVNSGPANPANFVNQNTANSATVEVNLDATATSSDSVVVVISDTQGMQASSAGISAPQGGGTLMVSGIDVSGLVDGAITIDVQVSDANLNSSSFTGSPAELDTTLPEIGSARVLAGPNNAPGQINSSNQSNVSVEVGFRTPNQDRDAQIVVTMSNGTTTVSSQPVNAQGSVTRQTISGLDASPFRSGQVGLFAEVSDPAGNRAFVNGETVTVDSAPPAGHISATVASTAANPVNVINSQNAGAVRVDVDLRPDSDPTRTVEVMLSDGTTTVSAQATAPTAGGLLQFPNLDCSSLADGSVSLQVRYSDISGNVLTQAGSPVTKDVVISQPTAVFVASGAGNAQNVVNASNASAVSIQATLASNAAADETFQAVISDGTNSILTNQIQATAGGGTITFSNLDLSGLADANLTLTLNGQDAAGNQSFVSASVTKDATPPAGASNAFIAAGPLNGTGEINASNVSSTSVQVDFGSNSESGSSFFVVLSDGVNSVSSATIAAPSSESGSAASSDGGAAGSIVVTGIDASSLSDGPITVRVHVLDAAGNTTITSGQNGTKNLSAAQPISANVAATVSNPANFINAASQSAVQVDVTMPSNINAGDTVAVTLSDGAQSASSTAAPIPAGGGVVSLTVDASALAEGSVTLIVNVMSANTNMSTFQGTAAQKDTVAPATTSLAADFAQSALNPQGYVNMQTASSATVHVTHGALYAGNETLDVSLTDGATSVSAPQQGLSAGIGKIVINGMDISGLADGTITASITVTDPAGNAATISVPAGQKDTTPPNDIVNVFTAPGTGHQINVVNPTNLTAAQFVVETAANGSTGDEVEVILGPQGGGLPAVTVPRYRILNPGTREPLGSFDLSAFPDGTLEFTGRVYDVAGNSKAIGGFYVQKDTTPPSAPTSANVAAGANNAMDFINIASASAVMVDVVLPASSVSTDMVSVTLTDGLNFAVATPVAAPAGGGTVTLGPIDVSALNDGSTTLTVTVTDNQSNAANFTGTSATKDTTPPDIPTVLEVAMTANNPASFINATTQTSVTVEGTWPATATGQEQAIVTLGSVQSASMNVPQGGGLVSFTGLDVSAIADGTLALSVAVTEPSGNTNVFVGTLPVKDTVAPVLPTLATVPSGANNPADVINTAIESATPVDVTWPAGASASDLATVTLSDGTTTVSSTPINANPGGMTNHVINAQGLSDGALTMSVDVTDSAGNTASFSGNAVTKDTTPPMGPSSSNVAAGANNAINIVNTFNVTTSQIDVAWPAGSDASDTFTITVSDGAASVISVSANVTPGATTMTSLDLSSLADGALSIAVDVNDINQNSASFAGTGATKDTMAPAAPTSATVAAGANNAMSVINTFSVTSAQIDVVWPAGADAADTFTVTLSDGASSVTSASASVAPGATSSVTVDASSLAEGAITVQVDAQDAAGNMTQTAGTSATKDTTAPMNPTTAGIAAGANNAANTV
ncbi:MAG TPA: hypothetical protein ENK43_07690, partial [Planctomycetes bacterium]|nr:hypothetical protein [Planctomycetota bacterium]